MLSILQYAGITGLANFIQKAKGRQTHSFFYKITNNFAQVSHEHILTKLMKVLGRKKPTNLSILRLKLASIDSHFPP